jgi:hypothetical protein
MAQAIVEKVMGDDENLSDDESGANLIGLRHLCYTDKITLDSLNASLTKEDRERMLHRAATQVIK